MTLTINKSAAIAAAKADLLREVSALRLTKIGEGFTYEGEVYQIGPEAIADMTVIYTLLMDGEVSPHGGSWRTTANTMVPMTDVEVKAFILAAKGRVFALKQAAWSHVEAINGMTDARPDCGL